MFWLGLLVGIIGTLLLEFLYCALTINELEDYICAIEYDERHSDSWQIPVRIHNKLKELKGSDE